MEANEKSKVDAEEKTAIKQEEAKKTTMRIDGGLKTKKQKQDEIDMQFQYFAD